MLRHRRPRPAGGYSRGEGRASTIRHFANDALRAGSAVTD